MHIDEVLDLVKQSDGNNLIITNDWAQGRTVFGGLSAAIVFAAARAKVSSERLIRSFSCNFVGPFFVEQDYSLVVEILREGKNVSTIQSSIKQNGKICVHAQSIFGGPRQSKLLVENNDTHAMSLPKKPTFMPAIPKLTPKALKNFELAFTDGGLPFKGSKNTSVGGWMRFKKRPQEMSISHLIALIDAWPPTLLQMLRLPAPASTMTWTINFVQAIDELSTTEWFAYQSKTRHYADGYGITDANIWDQDGRLLAMSNQIVTLFT